MSFKSHGIQLVSIMCVAAAVISLGSVPFTAEACNNREPRKIFCTNEPENIECSGRHVDCDSRRDNVVDKEADFGEATAEGEQTIQTTVENGAVCYTYTDCNRENLTCTPGNQAEQKAPIYTGSGC